ncbi:NAD-dependent epimerase/dehydratase family protein [Parvularcula lutaonensis]|uniref:NAD-dependent epimerase/dehydratase family protein n=1 Tax=Parvularcula lutaonensis TaxID=491923 RepID=A0ABV7MEG8_9PROT|nr:NAD-dependent epimerase/dehydratase family protein [Parvularcula lutaonensis]GGY50567.1 dihydroflavonol-4-reductase [Parvularcula lutaonensis]
MVKELTIDRTKPVMVTGATGYVAGWLVKRLLEEGLTVHAPVRDPDNEEKRAHLDRIAAETSGKIRYFAADLLDEGSYGEAMAGCGTVFHTASPFKTSVNDPQKELVDPARLGTRNVLLEANRQESVKRVVLTSSCAAIYTDAIDTHRAPGGRLTEDVWNETASLDYQPYSYSKTVAEQEAWAIARAQTRWELVVVNPSLVIGPALQDRPTSESFELVKRIGDGTMRMGAPKVGLGCVDVRDLADAHMAAAFLPEAEGRHIVSGHETNLLEMAKTLEDRYGDRYPIPKNALPKWLMYIVGPMNGFSRKFVERNVNISWHADNTKAINAFGLSYRPMKTSMEEMFQQMIDAGMLEN